MNKIALFKVIFQIAITILIASCESKKSAHTSRPKNGENEIASEDRDSFSNSKIVEETPSNPPNVTGAELLACVVNRDFETWRKYTAGLPLEGRKALTLRLYQAIKAKGWPPLLPIPRANAGDFPGMAELYFKDFQQTPEFEFPPEELFGWGERSELLTMPKYQYAEGAVTLSDSQTMRRIWTLFPSMTESDQRIISMVTDQLHSLDEIHGIVNASACAKSEIVKSNLLDSASRVICFELENPETAEAAMKLGEELKSSGVARDFLLKAMQNKAP